MRDTGTFGIGCRALIQRLGYYLWKVVTHRASNTNRVGSGKSAVSSSVSLKISKCKGFCFNRLLVCVPTYLQEVSNNRTPRNK